MVAVLNLPTSKGRLIHSVLDCMKSGAIKLEDGRDLIAFMIKKDLQLSIVDAKGDSPLQLSAELGDVENPGTGHQSLSGQTPVAKEASVVDSFLYIRP